VEDKFTKPMADRNSSFSDQLYFKKEAPTVGKRVTALGNSSQHERLFGEQADETQNKVGRRHFKRMG
jgi:hypothetical protein